MRVRDIRILRARVGVIIIEGFVLKKTSKKA